MPAFRDSVRMLNAQFWLLRASTEHLAGVAPALKHLQGRDHAAVLGGLLPFANASVLRVRLRNASVDDDLGALAGDLRAWLPSYFLILAKSAAEGHLIERLGAAVASTPAVAASVDVWRAAGPGRRKALSRTKAIEAIAAATVRGSYDDLARCVGLGGVRATLDGLQAPLLKYARARNQLAHRLPLGHGTRPTLTVADFETYVAQLATLVARVESVL